MPTEAEVEQDTAAHEEVDNLMELLLPEGKLPMDASHFGLHYSKAALDGWVKQRSPACAAASVVSLLVFVFSADRVMGSLANGCASQAGAWNALLQLPRTHPLAKRQDDVVAELGLILQGRIEKQRAAIETLLALDTTRYISQSLNAHIHAPVKC